ncbi:AAA family ATPase [Virgibacillus sp. W0430]|uniref:AAA family ATPase n=1 Tax=Virgibacillus sp. W0430 TaxID=3391580 RepID=UPI003F448C3C
MKPLKLKLTAFGPYKNTEIIDFTTLKANRLFVISGNTGAGKTTIFDGICFALYGSASGQDRENYSMLRSDFADDDVHTAVELTFDIHGKQYRIFRQLAHVKKGNKNKTGDRYEFVEFVDGIEKPCVDRPIVSEINKKIESLIGLTQDQFKQIVMLPQGEFRKLLTSQTENKEAILRRLFRTESYQQIGGRLKERKDELNNQFKREQQLLDTNVQSIQATLPVREQSTLFQVLKKEHFNMNQLLDGLDEEIVFYENKIIIDEKAYEAAYNKHDKSANVYFEQKIINERFEELEDKQRKQKELEQQLPAFNEKERLLKRAEKANELFPYESQLQVMRQEEKAKAVAYAQAQKDRTKAIEQHTQAKQTFDREANRQGERDAAAQHVTRLREFLPAVKEIDEKNSQLEKLRKDVRASYHKLEEQKKYVSKIEAKRQEEENEIKRIEKEIERYPEEKEKLLLMREQATALKRYLEEKQNERVLTKEVQTKQASFEKMKTAYKEVEKTWLHNQAAILASHLHDGDACPVCGSENHPNKAREENLVTTEQLEKMKQKFESEESAYREVSDRDKLNKSRLQEFKEALQQYGIQDSEAEQEMERLVNEGKQLKVEVANMEANRKRLTKLKDAHEQLVSEHKRLEEEYKEIQETYVNQKSNYDTNCAVQKERVRAIPENARSLSALEQQITEAETKKTQLLNAWEMAQRNFQQAQEAETRANANSKHAKQQWDEAKRKCSELETHFFAMLKESDFPSESKYEEAKMSSADRQSLKEKINNFKQNVSTIHHQVKELQDALKDKQKKDLTEIHAQLQHLKQAYEQALKIFNLSKDYLKEAHSIKEKIENTYQKVRRQEEKLVLLTDLYDVIRGQNSQKISFERYLQMEYLEQIIDAANHRLKRLSNGQFLLMRSDRQETHGRQSGLALDVYDAYTGQTRDVKSLSGGEKFNASLSLALGMSDVIQSFQGNIAIDTMFIDEGFGSLDEESLYKAIDTLIELQRSGRTIGVISHVKELKAMFPAILEVTKTNEGSSKTKFIIQ